MLKSSKIRNMLPVRSLSDLRGQLVAWPKPKVSLGPVVCLTRARARGSELFKLCGHQLCPVIRKSVTENQALPSWVTPLQIRNETILLNLCKDMLTVSKMLI